MNLRFSHNKFLQSMITWFSCKDFEVILSKKDFSLTFFVFKPTHTYCFYSNFFTWIFISYKSRTFRSKILLKVTLHQLWNNNSKSTLNRMVYLVWFLLYKRKEFKRGEEGWFCMVRITSWILESKYFLNDLFSNLNTKIQSF